jgi:L-alanine-DL-glutamate epimerase-like enolase superfamily enzyme
LLVAETSDGAHMNVADFIVSGAATAGVRTSVDLKGGVTGAMRVAHLADAFQLRAEVHGPAIAHRHLCMTIPNTTYYESLVTSNPVVREEGVDDRGMVSAPTTPGIGLPAGIDYPPALAAHLT